MTTTRPISPSDTLADLATSRAGASRVFARHNLDFCCHGQVSLAETCGKKEIDIDALIGEIEAEERRGDSFERWDQRPLGEVIDHLLTRFHEPHRQELPRLCEMAARVEKVHGDKQACPNGLAALLHQLTAELNLHMQKEEQILFPMIGRGDGSLATGPIQVMEQEHVDAGAQLEQIRELTNDHTPPPEACGTWRALYLGLAEFERDLMQHVHLENYVLFPRALQAEQP
ncbi:MAG: iron-sulfur cluster repair protein YtfE [Planctomycetes bacterium]|nr:iron-sulfur cluster repair protein YtfE [Planctomycetota bacterium]